MSADGVKWDDLKPVAPPAGTPAPTIPNPRATATTPAAAAAPAAGGAPAWDDLTPIARPVAAPAAAETGDFMRGLKTSAHQLPQLAGGSVAFLGDAASRAGKALGGDGAIGNAVVDYGLGVYKKHEDDTKQLSKESDSFTHMIQNPRELGSWLKYNAGYMGGQMLESAAVMGAGALAGSEVPVAGNAAGAVAGLVAKPMVKRMVFKKAGELMAEKGLSREAAEIAAKQAVNKRLGAEAGAAVAGFGINESQELGSIYGEAHDQAAKDGRELSGSDLARIGVSSVAAAGVDTLGDRLLLGDALKGVKAGDVAAAGKSAVRQRLEATGAAIGKDALKGGATEAAQTVIERYGAGQSLADGEAFTDVVDSTMAGVVGGGMAGVGAGLHTQKPSTGPLGRVADAAGEHAAAAQAAVQAAAPVGGAAVAAPDAPTMPPRRCWPARNAAWIC